MTRIVRWLNRFLRRINHGVARRIERRARQIERY